VPSTLIQPVAIITHAHRPIIAAAERRLRAEGFQVHTEELITPQALAGLGRLDALVLGCEARTVDLSEANALNVAEIGNGAVNVWLKHLFDAMPMLERSKGRVVSVLSSPGRYRSGYFKPEKETVSHAPQALANGAILGLTRQLSLELAPRGISLNAVVAGVLEDSAELSILSDRERRFLMEEISLGRPGRPEEVAAAISFLASPASKYIAGDALDVNGGWWMS
jgi:NAD(P)-dependent dehydrogenase (short-subunit alcohol dehydrogenase family)